MSRLQFSTLYTRVEEITEIKDKRDLIKDALQWSLDMICSAWCWRHLMGDTFITTVAPYTTGTVSVTNGSTTVTGLGTTFTSAMVGRKIRIDGSDAYYRISALVSGLQITLEVEYQGDTDSGLSYSIYQDEYKLPANLDKLKVMRQIEDSIALISVSSSEFDYLEPTPNNESPPNFSIIIGNEREIYSTGTISASNNSSIITGAGSPAWTSVQGLGKGSRLTVGTNVYTVKSVDTDTQITIYELTSTAISAGTTYEILLDNYLVQFFDIPDSAQNIYFRFQRIAELLYNDQDIPDIPQQYVWLLILGAESFVWRTKDKEQANVMRDQFLIGIERMKKEIGNISQDTIYPKKSKTEDFMTSLPLGPRVESHRGIPFRAR